MTKFRLSVELSEHDMQTLIDWSDARVAAERERCARIVEEFDYLRGSYVGRAIARAIRDGDPATDPEPLAAH